MLLFAAMAVAACGGGGDGEPAEGAASRAVPACATGAEPVLVSFARSSGATAWQACSDVRAWRRVLDVSGRNVYVVETTQDEAPSPVQHDDLVAFDVEDGRPRWRAPLPLQGRALGAEAGPVAAGGVVVLLADPSGGPQVIGLDEETGEQRWAVPAEATQWAASPADGSLASPADTSSRGPQLPVAVVHTEQLAIVPAVDGLRALDRRTGHERWRIDGAEGAEAAVGDTVIAHTRGGLGGRTPELVGIDGPTGTIAWQRASSLHAWHTAPGVLVGRRDDTSVSVVDATTGTVRWTQPGTPSYGGLVAVGDDVVVLFEDRQQRDVVGYDVDDGALRWRRPSDAAPGGEPQVAEGDTAFLLGGGLLTAIATGDGTSRWSAPTPTGKLESSVGADADRAYVTLNTMPWGD